MNNLKKIMFFITMLFMLIDVRAFAFEGIIKTKDVSFGSESESAEISGLTPDDKLALEAQLSKMKEDLKTAKGDNKAWLEQEIAALEQGLTLSTGSDMSTISVTFVKGERFKTYEEQAPANQLIFKEESFIMVDTNEKIYTEMTVAQIEQQIKSLNESFGQMLQPGKEQQKTSAAEKMTVEKKSDTEKILGYTCQHYLVTKGNIQIELWVTGELENVMKDMLRVSKKLAKSFEGAEEDNTLLESFDQVNGFPLRIIESVDNKKVHQQDVQSIEKKSLKDSEFEVPTGYLKYEISGYEQK